MCNKKENEIISLVKKKKKKQIQNSAYKFKD